MNNAYPVAEIFESFQMEGLYTGTPAVFVRLSGCNLKCAFCDTDHTERMRLTVDDIADCVSRFAPMHVVITGGEPTIHDVAPLIKTLQNRARFVHVETNGFNLDVVRGADWITCSPKFQGFYPCHELKVVYTGQIDLDEYSGSTLRFLQPCSWSNVRETLAAAKRLNWRVSFQWHKILGIS